jgi:hypothetical protein
MTIMVLGVVLSVTLAIVELSLQHLSLSVDSKDSEIAFHAANAGLECARYMRRHSSSSFEGGTTNIAPTCFGTTTPNFRKQASTGVSTSTNPTAVGVIYRYKATIASNNNRCSVIDMLTMIVSTSSPKNLVIKAESGGDLDLVFPGYGPKSKSCAPGAICTIVSVAGYNAFCNGITADGVLKRQVLLEF